MRTEQERQEQDAINGSLVDPNLSRYRAARAASVEISLAKQRGELVTKSSAVSCVESLIGAVTNNIGSLHLRAGSVLAMQPATIIEEWLKADCAKTIAQFNGLLEKLKLDHPEVKALATPSGEAAKSVGRPRQKLGGKN